ncbi:MAG: DUF2391 family protein [Sphingomonadaceae bacterium]|nr:MAG: DUF2391 family protein [Sphingomonadaceae bacterium]
MAKAFAMTPLDREIEIGEDCEPAWRVETRDVARGFAGALFVSLPLLYTLEMWEHGRSLHPWSIVAMLVVGYFVNVGLCAYASFRQTQWESGYFWDALVCMGIGAVASAVTLLVTGIIDFGLSPEIIIKLVALEIVPTSMGAAVARNQLGSGDSASDKDRSPFSSDMSVVVGSILGGVLFAFNIAPTIEPKVITLNQNWWLLIATVILSLAVSYLVVNLAKFDEKDYSQRKIFNTPYIETSFSYALALLVSFALLWAFGYIGWSDPPTVWIPLVVTMAYATTLGGAAGRLIL